VAGSASVTSRVDTRRHMHTQPIMAMKSRQGLHVT